MKKLVNLLFIIIAVFTIATVGSRYLPYIKNRLASYSKPCSKPVTYKLGTFDSEFKLSQEDFKKSIENAANIWNTAAGKILFEYKEDGEVPINLVYDKRQQATDQLKKLNITLDNTRSSYDRLKLTYLQYQKQYQNLKSEYNILQTEFEVKKREYEQAVAEFKRNKNSTEQQADELNAQGQEINQEVAVLNQKANELNELVKTINALVETINPLAKELNITVDSYNTIGENLGEFEEGQFVSENGVKRIDIFQFSNEQTLNRVLAHELGHSLGLNHVENKNSIMYKLNESTNQKPTQEDLSELQRICMSELPH